MFSGRLISLVSASTALSSVAAFEGYSDPIKLAEFSGTLATVTSILIAMSLAISAIVAAPFKASQVLDDGDGRDKRVESVVLRTERDVLAAQSLLFYLYLVSLFSLLTLWWVLFPFDEAEVGTTERVLAAAAAFSFSFSFIISARTPSLLSELMKVRRELGA